MKNHILPVFTLLLSFTLQAQSDVMKITMHDGSTTAIPVADITEITFETEELSPAQTFAGTYTGTQKLTVGGAYTYDTPLTYTLTDADDGTLTVSTPEYNLTGTMMGDLTLGALTITGLEYDEAKGGFYRLYANDGLTQHFRAVNNGSTVFDNDYTLGGESSILIRLSGNTITVENPFKLGAMPLPLTATFEGDKK